MGKGGGCEVLGSWGGGRSGEGERGDMAARITSRLNETYHGAFGPGSSKEVAATHDKAGIDLYVPPAYRYNVPHFLRVVLAMPLFHPGDGGADRGIGHPPRLAHHLLDPAHTVAAALHLQALGPAIR